MKNNLILNHAHTNFITHGDGPPVILLHGVAGSLRQWDYLIPALSGAGYRALAVDLLGHGDSPRLNGSTYYIDHVYAHFAAWLESLDLREAPVIIAHSMGGYLALTHALRGHSIRGLLLISPYYTPQQLSGPVRFSIQRPSISTVVLQNTPYWAIESVVRLSHRNGLSALSNDVQKQMAVDFKRSDPGIIALPHSTEDLTPYLPRVRVPTMIVWGDKDLTLSPATFPRLAISIPDARSLRLPNCGHVPHLSHLDFFNETALKFLQEVSPVPTL